MKDSWELKRKMVESRRRVGVFQLQRDSWISPTQEPETLGIGRGSRHEVEWGLASSRYEPGVVVRDGSSERLKSLET
jgi:hypothetical protein